MTLSWMPRSGGWNTRFVAIKILFLCSHICLLFQDADEAEWAAFQKEIAVEVAASADLTAVDQMEETVDRQLEEIDDQMRAWSRVRDIEIKKDDVDTRLRDKKQVRGAVETVKTEASDDEVDEEDLDEFLDWRRKKT